MFFQTSFTKIQNASSPGPAESDMSLVMLTEESDSDSESSHSNPDNVSVQRSAVTMATAGSDAGQYYHNMLSVISSNIYFFLDQ